MISTHDVVGALSRLDLNLLVALDVLLHTENVTRAAERFGVTQSAMSHSLRRLREVFGDPLLVRSGAGMARTPRGEALVVPLRAALVALGRVVAEPEAFVPATATRAFRFCAPDLFDALLLPMLLDAVRREAPSVDLAVVPAAERLADALETGDIDLAVTPVAEGAAPPGSVELVRRTLFRDTFCCFVRLGHPALRDDALDLDAFVEAAHALVSPSGSGLGVVDAALSERGLTRRVALRLPTFAAAPRIVAHSDLVLTAPASMTGLLDGLPVVAVPPPVPLPRHGIAMLWHRRFTEDPAHRWLRDVLIRVSAARTATATPPARGSSGPAVRSP